jgi:2,3-bisphosphoglycerate-independent phosphoglycerate mutase
MIFADGVGLGREDAFTNPFIAAQLPNLSSLLDGHIPSKKRCTVVTDRAVLSSLNATLGVKGLPQSGTGQATIFTGVNAAKLIGQHFGPYPHSKLKPLLKTKNIFRQLLDLGKSVCFVNAYPKQYHEAIENRKLRYTVTTLSSVLSGMPLRGYEELRTGDALAADITGERWKQFGYNHLPVLTPAEAGERFCSISRQYDFTLFEYFLTDHAGHSRKMAAAVEVLERLDGFIGGVLRNFEHADSVLLFTSDHGNIEDISTRSHTRNPVPLILVGRHHERLAERVKSLTQITPAIVELAKGKSLFFSS